MCTTFHSHPIEFNHMAAPISMGLGNIVLSEWPGKKERSFGKYLLQPPVQTSRPWIPPDRLTIFQLLRSTTLLPHSRTLVSIVPVLPWTLLQVMVVFTRISEAFPYEVYKGTSSVKCKREKEISLITYKLMYIAKIPLKWEYICLSFLFGNCKAKEIV